MPKAASLSIIIIPSLNIGPEGSTASLPRIWALLAQYGVTMVLNGHDHNYQCWVPLDGNGSPSSTGITEFVVGSAGHGIQTIAKSDNRVAYSNATPPAAFGVILLQLSQTSASFTYQSINGSTLDSGVIPCVNASPVSLAPAPTSGLSPVSSGLAEVSFIGVPYLVTPIRRRHAAKSKSSDELI
jgi:hypothetical protein